MTCVHVCTHRINAGVYTHIHTHALKPIQRHTDTHTHTPLTPDAGKKEMSLEAGRSQQDSLCPWELSPAWEEVAL